MTQINELQSEIYAAREVLVDLELGLGDPVIILDDAKMRAKLAMDKLDTALELLETATDQYNDLLTFYEGETYTPPTDEERLEVLQNKFTKLTGKYSNYLAKPTASMKAWVKYRDMRTEIDELDEEIIELESKIRLKNVEVW